jgi:hypothetical protein
LSSRILKVAVVIKEHDLRQKQPLTFGDLHFRDHGVDLVV